MTDVLDVVANICVTVAGGFVIGYMLGWRPRRPKPEFTHGCICGLRGGHDSDSHVCALCDSLWADDNLSTVRLHPWAICGARKQI